MVRARKTAAIAQGEPELLSRKEAAACLGVSAQTLAIWKSVRRYKIPVIKVGRLARYRRSDLDRFLADRTVDMTTDEPVIGQRRVATGIADRLTKKQKSVEFAEVQVVDRNEPSTSKQRSAPLEIVLPSGISFRVAEGCSLDLIGSIISYLENR